MLFATFQLGFAIVTAALVSGAIADRAKFAAWMVFVPLWTVAVYAVVAHWVWAPGGWLFELGALDYAGGLVVEIVSGMSALALALVLGPRIGFKKDAMRPHNLPFVLLGCRPAVVRLVRVQRRFRPGRQRDGLGGLPEHARGRLPRHAGVAHGRADPRRQADHIRRRVGCGRRPGRDHAVLRNGEHPRRCIVGLAAGIVCSFAVGAKFRFGYDDSLDVVGVHFVGGVVGVLLIGLLATEVMTGGAQGLFYGGGFAQLGKQALGAVVVGAYAFVVSYVLAKVIDRVMGFRVSAEDETTGVDFTQHAETAYAEGVHGHQPSRRPSSSATSARRACDPRRPKKAETYGNLNRAARVVVDPSRVLIPAPASTRAVAVRPELQRHQQMPLDVTPELIVADEVSSCRLVTG